MMMMVMMLMVIIPRHTDTEDDDEDDDDDVHGEDGSENYSKSLKDIRNQENNTLRFR